jgi:hypothetical protein
MGALEDRTPRIDIELLDEVWRTIEGKVLDEAVRLGVPLDQVYECNRLDGWDQDHWRTVVDDGEQCGTVMCFAGWTAHVEAVRRGDKTGGWYVPEKLLVDIDNGIVDDNDDRGMYEDDLIAVPDDEPHWITTHQGVPLVTARYRACRVLGIDQDERARLFDGDNTFADVQRLVHRFRQEELMRRARQARWQSEQLKATPAQAPADPATDGTVE